jgi:iron complex transport system substrate-binding protein
MRIVSLVPAGTDILCALGLGSEVVGVSHECDHPPGMSPRRLTRSVVETSRLSSAEIDAAIAGQVAAGAPIYEVDAAQLAVLRPDLILTQGLCDVCALPARAVQDALGHLSPRPAILSLDARSIDGVLESMRDIGAQTGRERDAQDLVEQLQARLACVASAVAGRPPVSVVCLEWLDPPYACGHWIPEMVTRAGGIDLLGRPGIPSVPIPWTDIEQAQSPLIIAMPCGYDLPRAIRDVERVTACTPWKHAVGEAMVYVAAGGGYFTRPGPRLVMGIEVLASVFHPDVVSWPVAPDVIQRWP